MIKIVTGFGQDQKFSIPDEEAHKAYYLFLNPEKRGIFSTGHALIGRNIQSIEPDYHGTMGWHPSHRLDEYDWQEIKSLGVDKLLQQILLRAKKAAYIVNENPKLLAKNLNEILPDKKLLS